LAFWRFPSWAAMHNSSPCCNRGGKSLCEFQQEEKRKRKRYSCI
jgi:hypothetical protein